MNNTFKIITAFMAQAYNRKNHKLGKIINILIGVVEAFLQQKKPIGSKSLKELMFLDMSPATIRNHFCILEELGYLRQEHISGGRIPTEAAIRLYTDRLVSIINDESYESIMTNDEMEEFKKFHLAMSQHEISRQNEDFALKIFPWIESVVQILSDVTECAVAVSMPNVENDLISKIKLVRIDFHRIIAVITTQLGAVQCETITIGDGVQSDNEVSVLEGLIGELLQSICLQNTQINNLAKELYNEISIRFLLKRGSIRSGKIIKTGLAKLASHADLYEVQVLTGLLSFFEDDSRVKSALSIIQQENSPTIFIGEDVEKISPKTIKCSLIGIPYFLGNVAVGSVVVISPIKCNYRKIICMLKKMSESIGKILEQCVCRFKIELCPFPFKGIGFKSNNNADLQK